MEIGEKSFLMRFSILFQWQRVVHNSLLQEIAPERMRSICTEEVLNHDHVMVDLVDGALLVFEQADKSTPENNAHTYYTAKYNAMLVEALQNPEGFGTPLTEHFEPVVGEISQVCSSSFLNTHFTNTEIL